MFSELKQIYKLCSDTHVSFYRLIHRVEDKVKKNNSDAKELADTAYALREVFTLIDDMRKMCNVTKELSEKICCALALKSEDVSKIETEYCVATPDIKITAAIPKLNRDPERYKALMEYLGVPEEIYSKGLVDVNYKVFMEYLTALAHEGKPLPEGVEADKTYNVFRLSPIRKRKGVCD